ncbi:unnamed protein product, partial [Mesorhabditis belari]|uniref:G-protein coupled receptors family 1 profile domain-containing protein n=1 Tax=Mesorhabditis belari TaxID=2138241 RepID=A0AAF3EZH5_9BILA
MEMIGDILEWYGRTIHPPLVLALCISGSLGHLLSIGTLSRMVNPTNTLLISMSCCQLALCANFLYSTFFKWASDELCSPLFFSKPMATTMHVSVSLSVFVHMSGVFHVVALSIIRFCSLKRLTGVNSSLPWFTQTKCRVSLLIIYISVAIIGMPLYFTTEIVEVPEKAGCAQRFPQLKNVTSYELSFSNKNLQNLSFWLFNTCAKIIPSVILCVMTLLILYQLKKIRKISARFSTLERDQQYQRTTKMILMIMFMFICVELPQGLLAVLSTFSTPFSSIYSALGDFNEMITLLTACLIFFLFCAMNGRIRKAIMGAPCLVWIQELSKAAKKRKRLRSTGKDHLLGSCSVTQTPAIEKNGYSAMPPIISAE